MARRWAVAVGKEPGVQHRQRGEPCADRAEALLLGGALIAAVSDGAGSAAKAVDGATIALAVGIQGLTDALATLKKSSRCPTERWFRALAREIVKVTRQRIHIVSGNAKAQFEDYSATLTGVMATNRWVAAFQLGDGFVVTRSAERDAYELLFPQQGGLYANETSFSTSPDALDRIRVAVIDQPAGFLCLSTDGLEGAAIERGGGHQPRPYQPFFASFDRFLASSHTGNYQALRRWLSSPRLAGPTFDDLGIVVARRCG
jgi:hypothetical protein